MKRFLPLALAALAAAGCDAMTAHTGTLARAGQYELTVDETVDMMAPYARIPANTDVVRSLADLWVDYIILTDLLSRDATLDGVNLGPMVDPYVEQQIFMQLRDQVVTDDTIISDDDLRRLFEEEAPGRRARARHVLLTFPEDATEAQRDSVRALAEEIRERALVGEDFAEMARRYSEDPGSAQRGGDLGWFEAGQMVRPFEEAVFRLQPGEVSPVTETLFGLHVIRVEERETPDFRERAPEFRQQMAQQRRQESLAGYVESLVEPSGMRVEPGAADIARDLAGRHTERLAPRAATRDLVTWRGGSLTAGEYLTFLRRLPPQQRGQFTTAQDEQLEGVLREVATNELVLQDARRRGITVPQEEQDSVVALMRQQIADVARDSELIGPTQDGESRQEAVERRVRSLLEGVLAGERPLLPLGGLPFVLRQQMEWQIHERAFATVADRVEERREGQVEAPRPAPPVMDTPASPAPAAPEPGTPTPEAGTDS